MRLMSITLACICAFATISPAKAESPRAIIEAAVSAHGGDLWLEPGTLFLSGHAVFFSSDSTDPRLRVDDYKMWREFDADRKVAHGADGKVRIRAQTGERIVFEVGFDGETTWNERGIVPREEADAFWASNFGFGIIRSALHDGFTLEAAPARVLGGHDIDLVRIIDPQGGATLFGIDRESHFIRYMAFRTPRGWHERLYDDFIRLPDSGWVQARTVTLLYDGVKSNTVYWEKVEVGAPLDAQIFAAPAPLPD